MLICWGNFVINDGLYVELVKLQVLWYIICNFKQTYVFHKGQLNTKKLAICLPMKLFDKRKQQFNEKVVELIVHAS